MRAIFIAALVAAFALAPAAMAQTYVLGTQGGQNTGTTWPTPYGNWYSGQHAQYIYQAGELSAAGLTAGPLSFIGWDVTTPGGAACQGFEIKMGLTTATDLSAGWDTPAVVPLTTVYGPTNYQDVAGWNYHNVGGFVWDGSSNIIVEICFWNGPSTYTTNGIVWNTPTPFVSALTFYSDSVQPCVPPGVPPTYTPNSSVSIRPDTAFGIGAPPLPEFQINSAAASLDVNGVVGSPSAAANAAVGVGALSTLNLDSSNVGMGFEIFADAPGPLIGTSAGALGTMGGQVINMNLSSPGLIPLFNFALPPFPGTLGLPFSIPVPLTASAQMLILDPANPDGFAVSGGTDLSIVGCQAQQNFDNLALGNNAPVGWINPALGLSPWTVQTGTTSSTATGPLTGAFSPPNYMYCETSVSAGTQYAMDTCPTDVTTLSAFTLNFRLSRIGAFIGTLEIYQGDGMSFGATPIATYTGPEPLGMDWTPETISFVPTGPFVTFRLKYTAVTTGTIYQGDIAIDDFDVQ